MADYNNYTSPDFFRMASGIADTLEQNRIRRDTANVIADAQAKGIPLSQVGMRLIAEGSPAGIPLVNLAETQAQHREANAIARARNDIAREGQDRPLLVQSTDPYTQMPANFAFYPKTGDL